MWLAKIYFEHPEKIKVPKFGILLGAMIVGLGLTGVAVSLVDTGNHTMISLRWLAICLWLSLFINCVSFG